MDVPPPRQMIAIVVAIIVVLVVGPELSSARNAATLGQFRKCMQSDSFGAALAYCGTGVLILLLLFGAVGLSVEVYRSLK